MPSACERAAFGAAPPPTRRCRLRSSSTWSGVSSGFGRNCRTCACSSREPERQRHQQALALGRREHVFHQLAEASSPPARRARRSCRPCASPSTARAIACGDVADEHRLEFGLAAADQRQRRRHPRQRGEAVEEIVLRPEHDRGPQDRRVRHGARAPPLRPPPCCARRATGESGSAPSAETWIRRAPAAAAARATRAAPSACTASKRCLPRSNRMPTRLITTSASRTAASTEAG